MLGHGLPLLSPRVVISRAEGMSDIWYFLRDSDRYVYHYARADALIGILSSREFHFSKFADVDDPYEYQNWAFGYRDVGNDEIDLTSLDDKLNDEMKHSWRVGCFASDLEEAVMVSRDEHGAETPMRVHHRGHSLPAMWARYADNHAGACLVFDRIDLDRSVRESTSALGSLVVANRVKYENHRVGLTDFSKDQELLFPLEEARRIGLRNAIGQHIAKHQGRLFFLKSLNWKWQHEFRWVVRSDRPEKFHVPIGDALVGVALGAKFRRPKQLAEFCRLAKGWDQLSCSTMRWQNGVPYFDVASPDLIMRREGFSQRLIKCFRKHVDL
jgi:Protein of unknown function (DUF2971)